MTAVRAIRNSPARALFVLGLVVMLTVAIVPRAGASIYWAVQKRDGKGGVGQANLDGSHVKKTIASGLDSPCGLAVKGRHMFWPNSNNPAGDGTTIGRAKLDGTHVDKSFITGADDPCGIAVDAHHVYWGNFPDSIGRANLDGSHVDQNFIQGTGGSYGIAVQGSHIYWSNYSGDIGRADLNGQNP
ncbi:MAG: hypothetical protein QOJ01_1619, partial [Solirubrobacterales bacterium]|nr:hypothetical protein [Solirubrobacterales bacterium]